MDSTKSKMLGEQILKCVFRYRRLLSETELCAKAPCPMCLSPHLQKVQFFIKQQKPIHFILPAFPAKSPNPLKVLGPMPDMGERVALQFLQSLCDRIHEIYAPGAKVTICSDGRVFNDLVTITDKNVTLYRQGIMQILDEIKANNINIFNLDNVFSEMSFDEMRKILVKRYALSIESIRERVNTEQHYCQLFKGIYNLLFEDYVVFSHNKSHAQIEIECNTRTYQVIQRSNAWATLVAKHFPKSLRLSIHPQPYHSEKIGIHMIKTLDQWGTPWHNAPVFNGKEFVLMKRRDIESMSAILVYHNGRPSHYIWSDAKQFTGLSDRQARDVKKQDFHFNTSFTALNIPKLDAYRQPLGQKPFVFSMVSVKRRALNDHLLNTFISKLGLSPTLIKFHPNYQNLSSYGVIAA
ncbi:isocyanide synthase family protein [Nostoc sp. XA013]|nr:isocyanide synthase family protein [Nostoc sp. XA013]